MQPVVAGFGLFLLFASIAFLMIRVLPGPHRPADYMIAGSIATFVTLATALVLFLSTNETARSNFFGKKKKK